MIKKESINALRPAAEARLEARAMDSESNPDQGELLRLVHELQVHQIELEMQNEALHEARSAHEAALALYTDLYDFAPVGYLTLTSDGLIAKINLAAATLLGVERKNLLQKTFFYFVAPKDRDRWTRLFLAAKGCEEKISAEFAFQDSDGTVFHAQLDCVRCDATLPEGIAEGKLRATPGVRIALIDISARKLAEEALFKAGALQRAIFNSANFSSIATDTKGVIQIFNVGAERMLGYSAAEVVNKITPAEISDPQEVIARATALSVELDTPITPGFAALVFKASRGIEDIYELTYIRKDGSRFPAVVSVTALRDDQDDIIGYLLIGTDNTARKQIEAERTLLDQALKDKNVELERARILVEKANLAKSDFLSSMSYARRSMRFSALASSSKPAHRRRRPPSSAASIRFLKPAGICWS